MPVAPLRSMVPARRPLAALLAIPFAAAVTTVAVAAMSSEPRASRAIVIDHRAIAHHTIAPAVQCESPVEGRWIAHEHRPEHHDWIEHEIHIVDENGHLFVDHTARVRDGNERGPTKLDCIPDAVEFHTSGRATLEGEQLHVWGDRLICTHTRCDGTSMSYDLDSFTGRVSGNEFDAVNNDGATAVNRPYRFRRIACE